MYLEKPYATREGAHRCLRSTVMGISKLRGPCREEDKRLVGQKRMSVSQRYLCLKTDLTGNGMAPAASVWRCRATHKFELSERRSMSPSDAGAFMMIEQRIKHAVREAEHRPTRLELLMIPLKTRCKDPTHSPIEYPEELA